MDLNNTDTIHNGHSEAIENIYEFIAQRNQLQQLLIQRDITIEHLLSKGNKVNTQNSETFLISNMGLNEKTAERANEKPHNFVASLRNKSIEQLECDLLKDLNKSLANENENLKIVNKILQSNFDILNERLERVQSEHQSRLAQLYEANQMLKKSIAVVSTRNRRRSTKHDSRNSSPKSSSPESQNKRRRCVKSSRRSHSDSQKQNDVVNNHVDNGGEDDSSVNGSHHDTTDENDESDQMEDNNEDTEDDVIFVQTMESIDLINSDADNDCETEKENVKVDGNVSQRGEHSKGNDEAERRLSDLAVSPLSKYQIATKVGQPTAKQLPTQDKKIHKMEHQEGNKQSTMI